MAIIPVIAAQSVTSSAATHRLILLAFLIAVTLPQTSDFFNAYPCLAIRTRFDNTLLKITIALNDWLHLYNYRNLINLGLNMVKYVTHLVFMNSNACLLDGFLKLLLPTILLKDHLYLQIYRQDWNHHLSADLMANTRTI